jgi:membrane-associated phospholipid phosphatase
VLTTRQWRLILLVLLVVAFVALGRALPARGGFRIDEAMADWVRAHDNQVAAVVFTWLSWLGDTALAGLLAGAVLLLAHRRRWKEAATVAITGVTGMYLVVLLKPIFHRGRPDYAIDLIAGTSYSFPSGHSMASIVGFGIVAYFRHQLEPNPVRRHIIIWMASVIVLAVAFSRIYLGVHYVSDVTGGLIAGAIWLLLGIEFFHWIERCACLSS